MTSHRWRDSHTVRAQKEGFPARSVYKLDEIQRRYRILRKGYRVLDLGCAPGSWLLFASQVVGSKGLVVGVDLTSVPIALPTNVRFVQQDVLHWSASFLETIGGPFDAVLSDMAPSTTGNRFVDAQKSLALCESALAISLRIVRPKGAFVCKMFHGSDFKDFSNRAKASFSRVAHVRPKTTRKASKEIFIVALGKK